MGGMGRQEEREAGRVGDGKLREGEGKGGRGEGRERRMEGEGKGGRGRGEGEEGGGMEGGEREECVGGKLLPHTMSTTHSALSHVP